MNNAKKIWADRVGYAAMDQEAGRVAARILRPRGLIVLRFDGKHALVGKLSPYDEFRVKREETYGFVAKPTAHREGDRVKICFETTGSCDVTVAVEDENGRILRHLGSGVLDDNAPQPFLWNSKKQVLFWDRKDDAGEYVAAPRWQGAMCPKFFPAVSDGVKFTCGTGTANWSARTPYPE